eukprot:15162220-Alexandrium_andersonii.AAC.1
MPPTPKTSEDDEGAWEGCFKNAWFIVEIPLQPASSASEGERERERESDSARATRFAPVTHSLSHSVRQSLTQSLNHSVAQS